MIKRLFHFLTPTLLGNDGKASSRKVTAFWFVAIATLEALTILIFAYLMLFGAMEVTDGRVRVLGVLVELFLYTLIMVLALFGIITGGNVFDKKAMFQQPDNQVNIENIEIQKPALQD